MCAKAGDVAPLVARRVGVDHGLALRNASLGAGLADDLHHVVADGLGETRRVDGDDIGVVRREDGVDGLEQVGLAAEHGRPLGEARR